MMKRKDPRANIFRVIVILVILFVIGAFVAVKMNEQPKGPDNRVAFAQCLTDKGAKFYGAYWCPHCAEEKKLFGSAAMDKVTYIECAVPGNTQAQTQECKDKNIVSYPTWIYADGTRTTGVQQFSDLADKTGCTAP